MLTVRNGLLFPLALIVSVATSGRSSGGATSSLAMLHASPNNASATQSLWTVPAFALYDSVGVNTHLSKGRQRANFSGMVSLLANLGVRHIREGINPSGDPGATSLQRALFERYGIDSTETTAPDNSVAMWAAYRTQIGAGMIALEGANEPDNHQSNDAWIGTTLTLQKRVWRAVHGGSPALAGLQVEGPSILNCRATAAYGDQSAYADFANMHRYFAGYAPDTTGWGGSTCGTSATYGSLAYNVAIVQQAAINRPIRTTESGFCTANVRGCVPQDVAAEYEPQIFTTSFLYNGSAGASIPRSYIYELVSEDLHGTSSDAAASLGLTDAAFNPKPMYYAVQGFIAHVRDGQGAASGYLSCNISGKTADFKAIALRYSNGDYGMILYTSTPVWHPNGGATSQGSPIGVPNANIVFSVPGYTLNNLVSSTYDGSGRWTDSAPSSPQQISLSVSGYMHILRWSSGTSSPPTASPGPGPTPSSGSGIAINAGAAASGLWLADTDYWGGHTARAYNATIDTSLVPNPAPQAVYGTARAGSRQAPFTYTVPGLGAGTSHTVRLHFADNYKQYKGQRVFSVTITGTAQTLNDFDIIAQAGAAHKAIVVEFDNVVADSLGNISVTFTPSVDDAYVNGIEVR